MAKKATRTGPDPKAARKSARMRIKVVIMELRGIVGFVSAPDIDEATREDIEKVLLTCKDRLEAIARAFVKPRPATNSEAAANTEGANA